MYAIWLGPGTIILRRSKIQALQIGQQESVPLRVPCAVANVHGVGRVDTSPWSRKARHDDGGRGSDGGSQSLSLPMRLWLSEGRNE